MRRDLPTADPGRGLFSVTWAGTYVTHGERIVALRKLPCLGCTVYPTQVGRHGGNAAPRLLIIRELGRGGPSTPSVTELPSSGLVPGDVPSWQVCICPVYPQDGVGGWVDSEGSTLECAH